MEITLHKKGKIFHFANEYSEPKNIFIERCWYMVHLILTNHVGNIEEDSMKYIYKKHYECEY